MIIPDAIIKKSYKKLYPYQKDCVDKVMQNFDINGFKNNIVLPTGAGKTVIIEHLIGEFINKIDKPCVFSVACHRIMLSYNLYGRILSKLNEYNIKNLVVYINNSGDIPESDEEIIERLMKSGIEIKKFNSLKHPKMSIDRDIKNGNYVFIVSLYQSFDKIVESNINIDFMFYDECHISCQPNLYPSLKSIVQNNCKYNLFFTATPVINDSENNNSNIDVYGENIITVLPKELVVSKHLTPIKLVLMRKTNNQGIEIVNGDDEIVKAKTIVESTINISKRMFNHIKEDSNGTVEGTILLAVPGNKVIQEYLTNKKFKSYIVANKINVYITSSEFGGNVNSDNYQFSDNTKNLSMLNFITALKSMNADEKNIIINIDQLTEGIDLPNISSVILFRAYDGSSQKLIQCIGRAVRRADIDRQHITNKNVKWHEHQKFIKPFAYIVVPEFCYANADANNVKELISKIYNNYGSLIFRTSVIIKDNGIEIKLIPNDPLNIDCETDEFDVPIFLKEKSDKIIESMINLINPLNDSDNAGKQCQEYFITEADKFYRGEEHKCNEYYEYAIKHTAEETLYFLNIYGEK